MLLFIMINILILKTVTLPDQIAFEPTFWIPSQVRNVWISLAFLAWYWFVNRVSSVTRIPEKWQIGQQVE
jgi:hypothetical protein